MYTITIQFDTREEAAAFLADTGSLALPAPSKGSKKKKATETLGSAPESVNDAAVASATTVQATSDDGLAGLLGGAPVAADVPAVVLADVIKALTALGQTAGKGREAIVGVLTAYGAKGVTDIPADKYAECIAKVKALIG